ncbi:transglutaminase domain-containing protein [Methanobacterium sp. SMA-27]|uniref:transglutaminase domain-containing protein n=1 Tax=Methanobacterium sp. SMA-27 TaxID=1495336 RepID=UPI00069360C3|nr:transglutaminase domain-containing protein [Methanobacterium sp. SMA-27]
MLIFFSLALVLNVSASSAASVNQTNMSTNAISSDNLSDNISSSNYAADKAKSTFNTSVKIATTNATKELKINSTMAAGAPVLVNGLTLAQLKDGVSRVQSFFNKNKRLPKYVSFGTRQISIATFQKNIATQGLKINTVIVNGLTVAQMKEGISRVQAFYNKYGRLPSTVNYGTRKISISTFQENIATQGLKINTVIVNGLTVAQMKEGISRVQAFYNKYGRLPSTVNYGTRKISISTFQENIATQGLKINVTVKPKPVIDTSSVAALAKSLTAGSTSTYSSAVALFNWVRNNISYSFYYNTKYGASGTLKYRTGNCCDYSNLLVALARNAGITARYVHGTCQFSSGTWYGHVWTQLYVNGKWYNADAISTRNSFGVINNWNTATYKLNGYYTTLPF